MFEFELPESRTRPKMEDSLRRPRATAVRGCGGARSSAEMSRKTRTKGEGGDGGENPVRCTGRQCRSCTGGAVADCVAICCCPCAVLNCLALAFVKIPYLIGKRWCLGFRRKRKKKGRKSVSAEGCDCDSDGDGDAVMKAGNDGGGGGAGGGVDSWLEIGFEEEAIEGRTSDKLNGGEAEKVWVELCEFDHLSFGRVSFAGIPLQQSKANLEN